MGKKLLFVVLVNLLFVGCSASETAVPTKAPIEQVEEVETAVPTPSPTATPITPTSTPAIMSQEEIEYANVGGISTKLDILAPNEANSLPVVIVAHGVYQNKGNFTDLATAIASQGAVVYNINANVELYDPFTNGIERIACAVRFARKTSADYGGNANRIILVGNSAGANSGIIAALAEDEIVGDCVEMSESASVSGFVGYEGVYDIGITHYNKIFDHTAFESEDPEQWHTINPYSHIGDNPDLQIRLVHGGAPDVAWYDIPLEVSSDFYQTLSDAGYDVTFTVADGDPHTALTWDDYDAFELVVDLVMELAQETP